jgi:hypothetical protein
MSAKKITETTIDIKDAPTLPEQLLTYGEAIKLVAGVLRSNPDAGSVVVECLRDIVEGTGLNVTYEPQEEQEEAA